MAYRVGIVGATGAVGQELIHLLHSRRFPMSGLTLLASARSAGRAIETAHGKWTVQEAKPEVFSDLDVAIFSAGGSVSKVLAPAAVERGCVVIDNSSAFRLDDHVPLVVPEINGGDLRRHKGIIANPNCSTAIALMALYPLHREFGLRRFVASTYQAVSGTGAAAVVELETQLRAWAAGQNSSPEVYPHPIAFNVIPHVDSFLESGYTREEMKMVWEGRKIMNLPELQASVTCVRVPVIRAHSISIAAEFTIPVREERARQVIVDFPGAELCDDPGQNRYPMPLDYSGKEKCGVGRIRRDLAFDNGLSFWVSGDQLWRGAALNAVQIAEALHDGGWMKC